VKLGIAEFAAATPLGSQIDLGFKKAAAASGAPPIKKDQKDPWNYWVFRLGASIDAGGEAVIVVRLAQLQRQRESDDGEVAAARERQPNVKREQLRPRRRDDRSRAPRAAGTSTACGEEPRAALVAAMTSSAVSGPRFRTSQLTARIRPASSSMSFRTRESSRRSLTFSYTSASRTTSTAT
jgi:hypothetical protein